MKSWIQIFSAIAILICAGLSLASAQVAGDYGTAGTGSWGTVTNWVVCQTAGTWIGATPAPGAPSASTNVWIRAGHTDTLEASAKVCKNLMVESGGTLVTSATGNTLTVNGDAQIDGTLGSLTVAPIVQLNTTSKIFGSGTFYFSKIRPGSGASGITMTVDMDATGIGSASSFINCNNRPNITFALNDGCVLTLPTGAYISTQSNSSTAEPTAGQNFTINVYGTINAPVATGGGINLGNASTFTTTLNVFSTGVVNTGRLSAVDTTHGTSNVNLNSGGSITLTGALSDNLGKATIAIDGIFDCGSSTSRTFGTATVSSTGKLRIADGAFPGGIVNLNSGSTVEYYGTSGYTMPASPATYENLQINNAGGITLGTSTTVNGVLTLSNGALSIGNNTLTLYGLVSTTSGSLIGSDSSSIGIYGSGSITLPAITLDDLTLWRSDGLSLNGNVTVGGLLSLMSGIITTGANTLAIDSGGSVYRLGGYIIGTLQKHMEPGTNVPLYLELGTVNGYSPVDLTFANVASGGGFSGSIVPGDHPNLAVSGIDTANSANEYWSFATDATIDTYDGTLHFDPEDLDAYANTSNFVARAYNGIMWSPITVGTKTVTSTQISGPISAGGIIALGNPIDSILTITSSAGPNGTINPLGVTLLNFAASQAYSIAPDPGYRIDSVLVDEVKVDSTTSYTFINAVSDHTIRAVFAEIQYQIDASAGPNGSIDPSGVIYVSSGANQAFTFTPDAGHHVDSVLVDDVKVDSIASYTFINVTANHTIRVTFAINQYTISAISGPNGAIAPSGDTPVTYGATIAYTITPDANYHVDTLLVDEVKVDSTVSYTFINVTTNHTIRAVFAIDQFAITASAGAGGTITPSGTIVVEYGGTQAFAISANVHYQVDSVIVDGAKVDSTTSYAFVNITAPHAIRVTFAAIIMSIRSNGAGGGPWNDVNTWQGGYIPISSDTVTILGTDTVTSVGGASCRTINVQAGGGLIIPAAEVLTVASPDSASIIDGAIINSGTISASGKLQFGNGGMYIHAENGGSIPIGIWLTGSTCLITGVGDAAPSNNAQAFYNFTWANPGQISTRNLLWGVNSETTIYGDLTVASCGATSGVMLRLSNSSIAYNITIKGNVIVSPVSGFVYLSPSGSTSNGPKTITVEGNVSVSGGAGNFWALSNNTAGEFTWRLLGNLSVASGCTLRVSNSLPKLLFAKSGIQSFNVANDAVTTSTLTAEVASGSTLDMETSIFRGDTLFVNAGAGLISTSPTGLDGNFATATVKAFSKAGNYWFNGFAAQVTSVSLPDTVNNLTIDNANGVFLSQATTVNGTLYLKTGVLDNCTHNVTVRSGNIVIGSGSLACTPNDVEKAEPVVPRIFNLSYNYPNPFNPTTTIEFTVPKDGIAALTIYNLLGQKVATLFNGEAKAGTIHRAVFNASNLASGVYFSRLEFGSQKMVRRLMLMK